MFIKSILVVFSGPTAIVGSVAGGAMSAISRPNARARVSPSMCVTDVLKYEELM